MALIYADRVKDTVSSFTGSTAVNLANSAPSGFQTFGTAVGDANACIYLMTDASGNWEINYGVYTASGTKLARAATPIASSNAGAQATFSGAVTVVLDLDASFVASINQTGVNQTGPYLYSNAFSGTATTNNSQSTGVVRYVPVLINQWFSSVTLFFNIGTLAAGSATAVIGLYSNANGKPNTRLGQTTGIVCGNQGGGATGSNNSGSMAMSKPMPPGLYWVATVFATTAPTIQTFGPAAGSNFMGAKNLMGIADITTTSFNALTIGWNETSATLPSTAAAAALLTVVPIVGVAAVL